MPPDDAYERTYLAGILDRQLPRQELLDALQARLKEARKDENYRYLTFPAPPETTDFTSRIAELDARSNQEVYNVRELSIGFSDAIYICDGVNDQEQFKQAMQSVPEGEELILRIGPGTYEFGGNEPLYLGKRKIRFLGAGQGATIFKAAAESTMGSILNNYLDPVDGLTVKSITFDLSSRSDIGAMHIHQGDFVEVADCEFMGQKTVRGSVWLLRFGDYKGNPAANASYNLHFHDNYIHDNDCGAYEPLLIVNQKFPSIKNNKFSNNTTSAYEIVLYINNYFSVISNNQFTNSKAKSIGVMESQKTVIANNIAAIDEVRFVSVINSISTSITGNTATCKSTAAGESSCVELFDRQVGPDNHVSLINPSTDIEVTGNTISDFKYGVRAQIAGHVGVNDYKLNQRDILIERNNFNNITYLPIAMGADHIDNALSNIRVLRNTITSWGGDHIGAITFRGYKLTPMRGELHIQGNIIAPSTKGDTSGIRLINAVVSTVADNDVRGTGKTYAAISLVNANVAKASGNLT